jgi:hypothetical protein
MPDDRVRHLDPIILPFHSNTQSIHSSNRSKFYKLSQFNIFILMSLLAPPHEIQGNLYFLIQMSPKER